MDISSVLAQNLSMTQQAVSTYTLDKSMNLDAQAMATLLADMQAATPAPVLATPAGHMDIRV